MLKKLLLFFAILLFAVTPVSAASLDLPSYSGFVNDFEGILNNKDELEQKLVALEKETGVEIAVVTVSDFQDLTIEEYAVKLFEKWKIGKEKQDNGLLILVSSKQRKSRFEVGYGLEGTLPDGLTGRIQDEFMIPSFKDNDYSRGIAKGVDETIAIIKKDPLAISVNDTTSKSEDAPEWIFSVILFGIYIMAATKSWWFGGVFGGVIGLIWAFSNGVWFLPIFFGLIGLIVDFILSQTIVGKAIIAMSHSVGSSGSGRSGGGGGMSFGGGSSGGGGSSRSW